MTDSVLIGLLAAALFSTIGLLGAALFQLRGDMAGLRAALRGDIAGLRGELSELRTDVAEMRELLHAHLRDHGHRI